MKEKVNLHSDIDFHDMGALKLCYDLEKKIFDFHLEHYSDRNKEFIPLIFRFENIIEIKINHSDS